VTRAGTPTPAESATHRIDLEHPETVESLSPALDAPEARKFVEIEVGEVVNPKRIPISFEVHYRDSSGVKTLLGSFALFPPDNPGTFIVPTQGRLRAGGEILVELRPLAKTSAGDEVRVTLRRISLQHE
jgi:hypothetical protein